MADVNCIICDYGYLQTFSWIFYWRKM